MKPGITIDQIHDHCVRRLTEGMIALGLLGGTVDDRINDHSYRKFYMHGTSHWLGMDVHDVGAYIRDGKARPLEPGMVLTVEPGLYIAPDADASARAARDRHPDRGRRARHRRRPRGPHRRVPQEDRGHRGRHPGVNAPSGVRRDSLSRLPVSFELASIGAQVAALGSTVPSWHGP